MEKYQINMYMARIDMYESHIKHLERNKPYFFQKAKRKDYEEKINECINKINNIYKEIENEMLINEKLLYSFNERNEKI